MSRYNLIAAALLCALATPAFADDLASCGSIGELAGMVMQLRQTNIPLSEAMSAAEKNSGEKLVELLKTWTLLAYEVPSYMGEEMQARAVLEFRNSIELQCYKGRQ